MDRGLVDSGSASGRGGLGLLIGLCNWLSYPLQVCCADVGRLDDDRL